MVVRSSNHHGDRRFQLRIFTHQSKAREVKSDASEMVSRMRSWRQEQLWKKVPRHARDPSVGVRQLVRAGILKRQQRDKP